MSCMECLPAHIPSHSPTLSHMPMSSVTTTTGSTNDTHIPSPYRLTNTQCKVSMGNQSRVNHDSYHTTRSLCDKHDRLSYMGTITFRLTPQVSYTHTELFGSHCGSLTPMFQVFHLKRLTVPFLLLPTHINYIFFLCFKP